MDTLRLGSLLPSLRRFAAATTALTAVLISLGVYTAATGSGLACAAEWPLCSGGVLPQTLPDFVEWFHRLVAMIAGIFILGTALLAWRGGGRGTRVASTLAVVLLPLQISIGAVTVTIGGLVPGGYSPPTQAAHLLVALTIFTALVLTTLFAYRGHHARPPLRRIRLALSAAGALFPVSLAFSRVPLVLSYSPGAQALFVLTSLAFYAALVAAAAWSAGRVRLLAVPAVALAFVHLLLGRDLFVYTPSVRLANVGVVAATAVLIAGAAWSAFRREPDGGGPDRGVPGGD